MKYLNDMLKNKRNYVLILIGIWTFFAILFLRTAWLCDDAYISFRTIDNFVNGYGLCWNVNERVQAYTHPLWLFLHIPFYFLTKEMFLTPIFISFTVSMLTIIFVTLFVAQNTAQVLIMASILGFSRAFIDFSSSGLENPMSHLLLVLFLALFLRQKFTLQNLFVLSLISCLATLNRQDCILVYIPFLMYSWWNTDNKKLGLFIISTGFIPLFIWEIFSFIYYGFPFPNTAYAKLGAGIARVDLLLQGLRYYVWTYRQDSITSIVLFLGFMIPFFRRQKELSPYILGLLLYCIYILWIGGDFMGGRFFTLPLLLATIIIIRYSRLDRIKYGIPASAIFVISSILQPYTPILTGADFSKGGFISVNGITTERKYYYGWSSLLNWKPGKPMPSFSWANEGRKNRQKNQKMTKVYGCIEFRSFFSGPLVHIIDYHGLSDPLLARIPALYHPKIAIGHFKRYIPEGYVDSAGNDHYNLQDENLEQYYRYIRIITRDPIWSWERFKVILKMNLGYYSYLIDNDRYQFADTKLKLYDEWQEEIEKLPANRGILIPERGLEIRFSEVQHNQWIDMQLKRWEKYHILFFNGKEYISRIVLEPLYTDALFPNQTIKIPKNISKKGFDKIRIFVHPGEKYHKILESEIRTISLSPT
ncbi:MAG TPA: hypothetical protein PK813_06920 [Candidatus Hydrogenedens sp.]|nr:hypothetical protein [Candidatus Hydrogenedens sp.]